MSAIRQKTLSPDFDQRAQEIIQKRAATFGANAELALTMARNIARHQGEDAALAALELSKSLVGLNQKQLRANRDERMAVRMAIAGRSAEPLDEPPHREPEPDGTTFSDRIQQAVAENAHFTAWERNRAVLVATKLIALIGEDAALDAVVRVTGMQSLLAIHSRALAAQKRAADRAAEMRGGEGIEIPAELQPFYPAIRANPYIQPLQRRNAAEMAKEIAEVFGQEEAVKLILEVLGIQALHGHLQRAIRAKRQAQREETQQTAVETRQSTGAIDAEFSEKATAILRRRGYIPEGQWEMAISIAQEVAEWKGEETALELLEHTNTLRGLWARRQAMEQGTSGGAMDRPLAAAQLPPSPPTIPAATAVSAGFEDGLRALIAQKKFLLMAGDQETAWRVLLRVAEKCGEEVAIEILERARSLQGIKNSSTRRMHAMERAASSSPTSPIRFEAELSAYLQLHSEWDYSRIPRETIMAIACRLAQETRLAVATSLLLRVDRPEEFVAAAEEKVPGISALDSDALPKRAVFPAGEQLAIAKMQEGARPIIHALIEALPQYVEDDRLDAKRMTMTALEHYRGDKTSQQKVIAIVRDSWGANDLRFQLNRLISGYEESEVPSEESPVSGKATKKAAGRNSKDLQPEPAPQWVYLDELEKKFLLDFLELSPKELEGLEGGDSKVRRMINERLELLIHMPPNPERARFYLRLLKERLGIEKRGISLYAQARKLGTTYPQFRSQIYEAVYAFGDLARRVDSFDELDPADPPRIPAADPVRIHQILSGNP